MTIVNLYSQITSNPDELRPPTIDEIGKNNAYIMKAISDSERVIFGWGEIEKKYRDRVKEVKALVPIENSFVLRRQKMAFIQVIRYFYLET